MQSMTTHVARTRSELRARRQLFAAPRPAVGLLLVCIACGGALAAGWRVREDRYLVPDSGLGYALGITGLGLMLLLLAYPIRKRLRARSGGRLQTWFRLHMILGVLGPTAILFHANFRPGSLNSNVALTAMLLVASSGFVGRFIHARVHRAFFSRHQALARLRGEAQATGRAVAAALSRSPAVAARLRSFERYALPAEDGLLPATRRLPVLGFRARALERACRRHLGGGGSEAARAVRAHVRAVARVSEFRAYDRLFSLWHALHVPLCVILFGAAAVHVVAVHLY
jgi:hypothetical protein